MSAADLDPALPVGYAELLEQLKTRVAASRAWAARATNTELLRLYHSIGHDTLTRQQQGGWGAKIIDRSSTTVKSTEVVYDVRRVMLRAVRPSNRPCH